MSARTFTRSKDALSSIVAGEVVLMSPRSGEYFGLQDVGAVVWDELGKGQRSLDQLIERVLSEYDADEDLVREDLNELLGALEAKRLIERHG
jgi:hypothetical protein